MNYKREGEYFQFEAFAKIVRGISKIYHDVFYLK